MTKRRTYLLLTALLTLLFIILIAAGSHLIASGSRAYGVACFLFAFGAAFGQIAALALFLRQQALDKTRRGTPQ